MFYEDKQSYLDKNKYDDLNETNKIVLVGQVEREMNVSSSSIATIRLKVKNNNKDNILRVYDRAENLTDLNLKKGTYVKVEGKVRTMFKHERLFVSVQAQDISQLEENGHRDECKLIGHICKPPKYRVAKNGLEICESMIAVRETDTTDTNCIPFVTFGKDAKMLACLDEGEKIMIKGVLVSRMFFRQDGTKDFAYEVNARDIVDFEESNRNK